MSKKQVYLDHNATTPLHPEVQKAITESLSVFGNPSSFHQFGRTARSLIENSRAEVASLVGSESDEIVFVGSGSEANNTVLSVLFCAHQKCVFKTRPGQIITTAIEHPCVFETARCLKDRGAKVSFLGVDKYGKVNMKLLDL